MWIKQPSFVFNRKTELRFRLFDATYISMGSEILSEQLADPILFYMYIWVQQNKRPCLRQVKDCVKRKLWWQLLKLVLCNGYVDKCALHHDSKVSFEALVPKTLLTETLHILHGNPCSGQF